MLIKEKNEELKFIISRFDHYYDSVNNKGNIYLAINTFILGGLMASYTAILDKCHTSSWIMVLLVLILISSVLSFFFTLKAIKPYLNTKCDNENGSLLFFGDVADFHANQHKNLWKDLTEDKFYEDLVKQSILLSHGLKSKFLDLNFATWAIAAQVVFIVITNFIILNQ